VRVAALLRAGVEPHDAAGDGRARPSSCARSTAIGARPVRLPPLAADQLQALARTLAAERVAAVVNAPMPRAPRAGAAVLPCCRAARSASGNGLRELVRALGVRAALERWRHRRVRHK
jgi:hypothetical protein